MRKRTPRHPIGATSPLADAARTSLNAGTSLQLALLRQGTELREPVVALGGFFLHGAAVAAVKGNDTFRRRMLAACQAVQSALQHPVDGQYRLASTDVERYVVAAFLDLDAYLGLQTRNTLLKASQLPLERVMAIGGGRVHK